MKLNQSLRITTFVFVLLTTLTVVAQRNADSNLLSEFNWRLLGPSSPAGRVWQVLGDERDPRVFYVCTAGGGLWKTTDSGTTLIPMFDHETSASTGAVAIAPSDSNVVWVGTGE